MPENVILLHTSSLRNFRPEIYYFQFLSVYKQRNPIIPVICHKIIDIKQPICILPYKLLFKVFKSLIYILWVIDILWVCTCMFKCYSFLARNCGHFKRYVDYVWMSLKICLYIGWPVFQMKYGRPKRSPINFLGVG